ncbi:tRNA (guanosine(46)-N7)-methyltransferase TrmB [Spiroplasma taiwanense]|uniref:tRNA (guanine-N(7)-)-methyltransferase n=1 Tax=Spiroplasma taiwanense CT-1 TaxID=1276220 RepID=S5MAJ7_9MOLU|nr:tRNA (guanosine(46)-N7)-methyltransferase TrmB [Spiroplasma taiwanense]AGR40778.1 tRNA (guanine-N(7)-)-methyltransferase [Spiroplasma taiwanense CT-1]
MRLRNKNWTKEYIKNYNQYVLDSSLINNLENLFKNNYPTFLEIGCGKGKFLISQAIDNQKKNFIAMEKEATVIGVALKKAITTKELELNNLLFLNSYAEKLQDILEPNCLDGIYLNFSDPWPKLRHEKKRLTHLKFLEIYWKLLKKDGFIEIKTDNDNLYNFSLQQIELSNFKLLEKTNDLYKNQRLLKDNVATEYEEKFHKMGKNINKIIIKKED